MSETHVSALDHTIHQTNVWLKKLVEEQHFRDRQEGYAALRAVMHALRDRLRPEQAAHLGAQLPTLVRGIYYEGWHLAGTPTKERTADDFGAHIAEELPPAFPRDPLTTARSVFAVLAEEIDPGEVAKVGDALPEAIRRHWPTGA